MANIELKFLDVSDGTTIETFKHQEDEGIIVIYSESAFASESVCIHLDKSTAIKFAKTLRTEINKIQ